MKIDEKSKTMSFWIWKVTKMPFLGLKKKHWNNVVLVGITETLSSPPLPQRSFCNPHNPSEKSTVTSLFLLGFESQWKISHKKFVGYLIKQVTIAKMTCTQWSCNKTSLLEWSLVKTIFQNIELWWWYQICSKNAPTFTPSYLLHMGFIYAFVYFFFPSTLLLISPIIFFIFNSEENELYLVEPLQKIEKRMGDPGRRAKGKKKEINA